MWKPNVFVLGPGGVKGYLELGLLLKFEEENYLSNVDTFIGCSVGASISLLLVSNCRMDKIINESMDLNLINDMSDINIDHLKDSLGLLSIKTIEDRLKQLMIDKFVVVPTLKQLFDLTNRNLIIVTFNLDKTRKEYISKDTDPDLSCVEAVMMSMAIPGLICPRIYKGNVYVDGAVGDPYPVLHLDDGINDILGVYIDSEQSSYSSDSNIFRYLFRCAQASMKVLRDLAIEKSSDKCTHIVLKTSVSDTISISSNIKKEMIEKGYQTANLFLLRLKDPIKYRLILSDDELPILNEISNIISDATKSESSDNSDNSDLFLSDT
jgi:predicted acylesterase/phospholipase RssA